MKNHLAALAFFFLLTGCIASNPVKPWQKATLAQPSMALGGLTSDNGLYSHIYTSKETAKGGGSISGGGCGCN